MARLPSLRGRIVAVATTVVAAALVVGGLGFVLLFNWTLGDGLRVAAEREASGISQRIESGGVVELTAAERDDDDRVLQLVDESGRVLDASEAAEGRGALATVESDESSVVMISDESYLVVADDAEVAGAEVVVVAGVDREDLDEALATVIRLVVIAVPVLVVIVALTLWIVAGRALRPVEAMRREVDEVSASALGRRIDQPERLDEIGRLAQTMNRMLHRLDVSQQTQRRFLSDASHELRSPLASLRQFAEVATAYPDRLGAAELADAIREEGGRLEAIVRGMLVLARVDEMEFVHAEVDIDDLLLAEASRLRASTSLSIDASAIGPARIAGSQELLAQVLRNLTDNAARHAESRVELSLREHDGRVTLAVDDDGSGVPEGEGERVFERFVRLDESRARDSGGSGLGLAIVRELVAAHGGSVRVERGALGGARFVVELPASVESGS